MWRAVIKSARRRYRQRLLAAVYKSTRKEADSAIRCLESLPEAEGRDGRRLRAHIRQVAIRRGTYRIISPAWGLAAVSMSLWTLMSLLELFENRIQNISATSQRPAIIVSVYVYSGLLILAAITLKPYFNRLRPKYGRLDLDLGGRQRFFRLLNNASLTATSFMLVSIGILLMLQTLYPHPLHKRDDYSEPRAVVVATGWCIIIALNILVATVRHLRHYKWTRRYPDISRLDAIMLRLLYVARWCEWVTTKRRWSYRRNISSLISELEIAAQQAERFALRGSPWSDPELRHQTRTVGIQMASVIRSHKLVLAQAVGPNDIRKVTTSLSAGLDAWMRQDLHTLIANSPEVATRETIRRLIRRLWPAVVLATLGVTLPALSIFERSPGAAQNLRATLLIAAVVTLATGSTSVSSQVNAIVDKSLHSNEKK